MTTNSEFGRRAAMVADALTEYDHLPTLGLMTLFGQANYLSPAAFGHEGIVALARWAEAFGTPVELETSPNWEIHTRVQLGGRVDVHIYVNLARQAVHELGVRLGVTVAPTGSASAEQLLAALHVEPADVPAALAPVHVLVDLLSLVGVPVPGDIAAGWTKDQRRQAEHWASATHLSASDNDVPVPARPTFLDELLCAHPGDQEHDHAMCQDVVEETQAGTSVGATSAVSHA